MIYNDTITLNGLKQDLYFLGKFNANTYNQNDLNRIINKYYKIVQEDIRAVNEDFFMVSTRADLALQSVNNGAYSFPTDMEKIKSLWVALTPASLSAPTYQEYSRVTMVDANAITNPGYAFTNPTAVVFGAYFMLYPFLTNTALYPVTNGMKMYYIPLQADLSLDSDTPNIFADYHDIITWGALIDLAPRLGDEKLLAMAQKVFKQRRLELKADASQRVLDLEVSYVEGQTSSGGWSFPHGKTGI